MKTTSETKRSKNKNKTKKTTTKNIRRKIENKKSKQVINWLETRSRTMRVGKKMKGRSIYILVLKRILRGG